MNREARTGAPVKWVRVRLAGGADGELVIRADRITKTEATVTFLVGDQVVFELDRANFHSAAYFVDRPTFAEWLRERRAQYPNQHKPWAADEAWRLHKEITDGAGWAQIAARHGRTEAAVTRKARAVEAALAALRNSDTKS